MNRTEVNIQTGEVKVIPLTPQEEADALARTAAEQSHPTYLQRVADEQARNEAKADATIAYLVSHTPLQCYNKVMTDVTDLQSAKQMMGRLAMALSVLARHELR